MEIIINKHCHLIFLFLIVMHELDLSTMALKNYFYDTIWFTKFFFLVLHYFCLYLYFFICTYFEFILPFFLKMKTYIIWSISPFSNVRIYYYKLTAFMAAHKFCCIRFLFSLYSEYFFSFLS